MLPIFLCASFHVTYVHISPCDLCASFFLVIVVVVFLAAAAYIALLRMLSDGLTLDQRDDRDQPNEHRTRRDACDQVCARQLMRVWLKVMPACECGEVCWRELTRLFGCSARGRCWRVVR